MSALLLTLGCGAIAAKDRAEPSQAAVVSPLAAPPLPQVCPIGSQSRDVDFPGATESVRAPQKEAWERQQGDHQAQRAALRARLVGWPGQLVVPRGTISEDGFLRRIATDTWRGLVALRDRENGLPLDNVRFGATSTDVDDAHIGDYTSSSNIGLFLIATVAAHELGLETRADALDKLQLLLSTMSRLEHYKGFLFNYYDTTSLERTSNLISFVDSAWLTAGLITIRQAFPELNQTASALIDRMDYSMFYDRERHLMSHGYYVHSGRMSPFHYGVLYTEARLGSLIAIGKGDVPEANWYAMVRTYPPACDWQSMPPHHARFDMVRGFAVLTGYYEWRGVRFVPSWGGSMFEALMPTLLVDEVRLAPDSLGANDIAQVTVQQRYAREDLNDAVWGQSSCSTPKGDSYREYGVPVLGARGYRAGAVTPHASGLAMAVAPEAAVANLWALTQRYDIYGDFGFYDSVDPDSGAVPHKYLALDQAMLLIAAANVIKPQSIQRRFSADPIVQRALPLLSGEVWLR